MSSNFLILSFSIVQIASECAFPIISPSLFVKCNLGDSVLPCGTKLTTGVKLLFQCPDYYQLDNLDLSISSCLANGTWSSPPPQCIPECGKLSSVTPLVVRGVVVPEGMFPWQAAIYHKDGDGWEFWCGGSLISEQTILTAAHCAWKTEPEELQVALAKFHRSYSTSEVVENPQFFKVQMIHMLDSYQDATGNYNGDLALLQLEEAATLGPLIRPVCLDWDSNLIDSQLRENQTGIVLGWGLTENDTFSNELRAVRMPVMSDDKCIKQQLRDFKKFVTYTSFCAGYANGSGVCNGDSGGGLSFVDPETDTWYLQGVVSLSPRRRGSPYCDPNYYTVFTKVAMFTKWIKKLEDAKAPKEKLPGTVLPYSENILRSAGIKEQ